MRYVIFVYFLILSCANYQERIKTDVYLTENPLQKTGTVWFKDTAKGLLVEVKFKNLSQGMYVLYLNENKDCLGYISDKYEVEHIGNLNGYLSGLVYLYVDKKGNAKRNFYIKNMNVKDIKNRSILLGLAKNMNTVSAFVKPFVACSIVK